MGFADFPFASRYLTLNGHRLHDIDEGEGPVLLFIHGNPTSSYLWRNVIKPLCGQYRCIALDHPDSAPAPLPLCGTPFQRQVRQVLFSGSTRHYGDIAQQLNSQARAVGQAVGKNRLAILEPCRRVTRADGGPGGFYWGTTLKQQLLDQERTTKGHAP